MNLDELHLGDLVTVLSWPADSSRPQLYPGKICGLEAESSLFGPVTIERNGRLERHAAERIFLDAASAIDFIRQEAGRRIRQTEKELRERIRILTEILDDPAGQAR